MMRIITSLGMIVFAGALVVGGTGAFFSDTEESTGNVFTAGAIDLKVDSQQHYNGNECVVDTNDVDQDLNTTEYVWIGDADYPVEGTTCDGTWTETDLGAEKFFNFTDVKPGDSGENTISLHVLNNDAYACVDVEITSNDDVTCTDPETDDEGIACNDSVPSASFDGELASNLQFFAWAETDGDNVWEPLSGELPLFSNTYGPASDVLDGENYTLAGPQTQPLPAGNVSYIGLAWCAGDFAGGVPGVLAGDLACDGDAMGNEAQTDSLVANIAFRVEQARNNEDFTCQQPI